MLLFFFSFLFFRSMCPAPLLRPWACKTAAPRPSVPAAFTLFLYLACCFQVHVSIKRRVRRVAKVQRAIVGASLEEVRPSSIPAPVACVLIGLGAQPRLHTGALVGKMSV